MTGLCVWRCEGKSRDHLKNMCESMVDYDVSYSSFGINRVSEKARVPCSIDIVTVVAKHGPRQTNTEK